MKTCNKETSGVLLLAFVLLFIGIRLIIGGQGGYRAGYSYGLNIRIGGVILVLLGVWAAVRWYKGRCRIGK